MRQFLKRKSLARCAPGTYDTTPARLVSKRRSGRRPRLPVTAASCRAPTRFMPAPKWNETERYHILFKTDHAVPATYDGASPSRSIFRSSPSRSIPHFLVSSEVRTSGRLEGGAPRRRIGVDSWWSKTEWIFWGVFLCVQRMHRHPCAL